MVKSNEKEIKSDNYFSYRNGFSSFKLLDPANILEIKPFEAELEKSRAEDVKSFMNSINEIRSDFETLKLEVSNKTKQENVNHLRKMMLNIGEKISNTKQALREEFLEALRNEESLFKDLQIIQRRMDELSKPLDSQIFKPIKQSSYRMKKTDSDNAVSQFQKFLSQTGGHYGGWEEHDHLLFLKERTKYKKKEKFFSFLHSLLPDLSYEEIQKHDEWYEKYESLKDSQKKEIQKWRESKETQKINAKDFEEKEIGEENTKTKKTVQRINIAERIKEWKNQQQLKKLEEEERQKKEKEKLKQEEKRKKELQEMKKLAVAQYKAAKLKQPKQLIPVEDQRPSAKEVKLKNKILLNAFRLQDLKYIEKKKVIRLQIESASSEKLRLTKPALEFILQRDPQRIFQPTIIWSQHCLETQKREKNDSVFHLDSIPRLAIPEWRRTLK